MWEERLVGEGGPELPEGHRRRRIRRERVKVRKGAGQFSLERKHQYDTQAHTTKEANPQARFYAAPRLRTLQDTRRTLTVDLILGVAQRRCLSRYANKRRADAAVLESIWFDYRICDRVTMYGLVCAVVVDDPDLTDDHH